MLRGIVTPAITALDTKGKMDFKANEKIVNRLADSGVSGILVLGSIGEFFAFTPEEKKEYIQFIAGCAEKRCKILVGTGGTVVDEVIELTNFAGQAGADGAVILSPYYFKLDDDSIYRYYSEVARNTELPFFLYNFPDRTAVNFSTDLVKNLALEFPNIIGIKDTVDSISHTRDLISVIKPLRKDFKIMSGFDEYMIANLLAGGDGLIGGLSNIVPEWFVRLYAAWEIKDFDTVSCIQYDISRLMSLYAMSNPFVAAIKTAVSLVIPGVLPQVTKPGIQTDETVTAQIRGLLVDRGIL